MKQLSVKEKAKRYDEAIERAKTKLTNEVASDIFPELKESRKDEMIRVIKEVILNSVPYKINILTKDTTITAEEAIAWLEKQGEQKSQGKTALEAIKEEKVDNANRVEPKFKVGNWIVHNISKDIFLIKSINGGCCTLEDTNGNIFSPCLQPTEDFYRLWTIQDAKDGDVLASKDKLSILIFRNLDTSNSFSFYYNTEGKEEHNWYNKCFIPATKKQRDLLFQKMHEAGYEWDADKKELKKKIEQNLTWSEEDMVDDIVKSLKEYQLQMPNYRVELQIRWLKSLKDRRTWKPSDQQMNAILDAIDYLGGDTKIVRKYLKLLYEDLKKL